ncbi:barstar family protein [Actinomadura gamaensis]|uniref:Barstar family protein n=1 Tax=Actinomadura gamaensis TaxID=1763541 RepID=A0ABV9TVV3_9ACTN
MAENGNHPGRARYALRETDQYRLWGECAVVDGFFGEPQHEMYELFGWVPEGAEVRDWVGSRVWLVPDGEELGPWLLEDVDSPKLRPGAESLVLTARDDYQGPPEGYRDRVRVHDGRQWLGSCQEFARIQPAERAVPPIVLKGLAPSDRLQAALAKGTRRALNLEEAVLEIRDDRGEPVAERLLWATVLSWRASDHGTGLIDLKLDAAGFRPVPDYARPVWGKWLTGSPDTVGAWADLDTRRRGVWLDLVRERACRRAHHDRPAGHAYELDGRHITDEPSLYLALGEAVNGPGGYFGSNLDAVDDCLGGTFGYTRPATLLWRDAATARQNLSHMLTPDGRPYDLFTELLNVLTEGGMCTDLA